MVKPHRKGYRAVEQRYSHVQRPSGNRIRLWALVRLFRISPSAIAEATGFSRCYVARLLSSRDEFSGSPEFFRALECKLGAIIDGRASQFFTVTAVPVQRARAVLERMPVEQAAEEEMARAA
jgi:transcriptional regulator with XRE-family HTH domain